MNLPIQPYDIVMLIVIIASVVFGAWKGMAWQIAALASLVVSAGVAVHGSGLVAPYITVEAPWNRCIAMLALYLLTSLGIWMLFRVVADLIDRVKLREFDRQVGATFGLAKGILWCMVITFFAVTLSENLRQKILHSKSGYYTALIIQRAGPVLPEEVRSVLGKYIEELDRKLDPNGGAAPAQNQPAEEPWPLGEDRTGAGGDDEIAGPILLPPSDPRTTALPTDDQAREDDPETLSLPLWR